MSDDVPDSTPRRPPMSEEHKAKMRAGREAARQRKAEQAASASEPDEPDERDDHHDGTGEKPRNGTTTARSLEDILDKHVRTSSAEIRDAKEQKQRAAERDAPRDLQSQPDERDQEKLNDPPPRDMRYQPAAQDRDTNQPDDYPPIEDIARRTRVYSGSNDEVPPPEQDPRMRNGMTFDAVDVPDLVGGKPKKLHTIEDLFGIFPIGDGQHYIAVDRKSPKFWGQINCGGMQRAIRRYMTRSEFAREYGGGEYALIVYGPPKHGALRDPRTGAPRPKPLCEPILVVVPQDTYPPNLQSTLLDDEDVAPDGFFEEQDIMRYNTVGPAWQQRPNGARPATPADAQMHRADLEHEREMYERQQNDDRAKIDREEAVKREAETRNMSTTQILAERADREAQRLAEQHEREIEAKDRSHERELRMLRENAQRPSQTSELGSALASIVTALKPSGNGEATQTQIQTLAEGYRRDIDRLTQSHQGDLKRMEDQLAQTRRDADARVREAQDRSDKLIAEAEKRADERIRLIHDESNRRITENREASDRRIKDAEENSRRAVEDTRTQSQHRLEDERRNHERDLKQQELSATTRLETQKTMYETRISAMAEEITRVRGECERHRTDAEKAKNLPERMKEYAETAELLGYTRDGAGDDGPKDWKGMLLEIVRDFGPHIPDVIRSAGDTIRGVRQPMDPALAAQIQQQQYSQMMAGPQGTAPALMGSGAAPYEEQQMAFGSEDGPEFFGPGDMPVAPQGPGMPPVAPPGPAAQQQQPMPQAQHPAAMVRQPQPVAAPVPQQQQPAQAGQGPTSAPQMAISDAQIAQFAPVLEQAFAAGEEPDDVAEGLVAPPPEGLGPQVAMVIASSISPQRIAQVLSRHPQGATSPLVRREGQKFLEAILAAVRQKAAGG